jgi:plasmid stabilization system protein ParE
MKVEAVNERQEAVNKAVCLSQALRDAEELADYLGDERSASKLRKRLDDLQSALANASEEAGNLAPSPLPNWRAGLRNAHQAPGV